MLIKFGDLECRAFCNAEIQGSLLEIQERTVRMQTRLPSAVIKCGMGVGPGRRTKQSCDCDTGDCLAGRV